MIFESFGPIRYHVKGKSPKLVILSGTHGDEAGVTPYVTKVIEAMYADLPAFLYIPEVSPSAVLQQTRFNKYGRDINRSFNVENDVEINSLKILLSKARKATAVTFHEDLQFEEFYLYDTGVLPNEVLYPFYEKLKALSVPLYSGADDPEDVWLGYTSKNGYIPAAKKDDELLFLEEWAINTGAFSRCLTIEMPKNFNENLVLTALIMQFIVQIHNLST